MSIDLIKVGKAEAHYSANYRRIVRYTIEMFHKGLNDHKILSAPELDILQNKVNLQAVKWNEKWSKIEAKRMQLTEKEANIEEAIKRTSEAQDSLREIENLLLSTLNINDAIDWNNLKSREEFSEPNPQMQLQSKINHIKKPPERVIQPIPEKPNEAALEFIPQFSLIDKIIKTRRIKKENIAKGKLISAIKSWEHECSQINQQNQIIEMKYRSDVESYNREVEKLKQENSIEVENWERKKQLFYKNQTDYNSKIDDLKNKYYELNPDSIVEYCELVLNNSLYPDSFPKSFRLEYDSVSKILVVEYELPSIESLPRVKEVKFVATKNVLNEVYISEAQQNKLFEETIYKIALRTLHELFEADCVGALDAISFNGWVSSINRATGKMENNCILSILTKRIEFLELDLSRIEPKMCFKRLKGVSASKLSSLTPIQPILQISKSDKRFVEGQEVVNEIDQETNLAAMDWEDFEHLVRELFEKEFQVNGGEVKVTRASRDGGVDAIAFDPDPIRGGKIVIQAKRYTNAVSVSAVRDLYGTVVNEGATKGILVSTADYGPDAYEFAKGKPLTLLNGSNLLYLLEKHGYHAKIDLKEAKITQGH